MKPQDFIPWVNPTKASIERGIRCNNLLAELVQAEQTLRRNGFVTIACTVKRRISRIQRYHSTVMTMVKNSKPRKER
jgi:hypothetical protein